MEQNERINVGPCRLSYPNLFTPQAQEGTDKKTYNVCLLIPKENKQLIDAIKKSMAAAIPDSAKTGGKLAKGYRLPLRDGDLEKADRSEYADMFFMNAKSSLKPQCVKKVNGLYVQAEENELYPGVWAIANVSFYHYDKNGNRGLGCSLNAVVKYKDDESFVKAAPKVEVIFNGLDIPNDNAAATAPVIDEVDDLPFD